MQQWLSDINFVFKGDVKVQYRGGTISVCLGGVMGHASKPDLFLFLFCNVKVCSLDTRC